MNLSSGLEESAASVSPNLSPEAESTRPEAVEQAIAALRRQNSELLEANARLSEAVAARDNFLAIAAHELRNPMTPIVGRVQLLRSAIRRPQLRMEKIEQGLDQIEWLIERYVKRATTLLDVSRLNSGKLQIEPSAVDAGDVISGVIAALLPLADHARSTLSFDPPASTITIAGDRLALEQIADNLVSNAIKYAPGAAITVSLAADVRGAMARICVADSGPGITAFDQARIFERFERAVSSSDNASGFGVGLWMVRQLAEAMAGSIAVQSEPGAGAAFTVTLPLQSNGEGA